MEGEALLHHTYLRIPTIGLGPSLRAPLRTLPVECPGTIVVALDESLATVTIIVSRIGSLTITIRTRASLVAIIKSMLYFYVLHKNQGGSDTEAIGSRREAACEDLKLNDFMKYLS